MTGVFYILPYSQVEIRIYIFVYKGTIAVPCFINFCLN